MEFLDVIKARYSVRRFSSKPVEKEKLAALLEAARIAPTAHNNQPQRILVIEDRAALDKLPDCTPCHFNAPLALLVCADASTCWHREDYDGKDSADVDAAIIGSYLMLTAVDLGLGSCWVMHFDPDQMRKAYQIPEELVPVALFPIGYLAENARPSGRHEERKSLEEITTYNQF